MDWIEILKVIGGCALAFFGLILYMLTGWIQVTWDMSEEEKAELLKYIEENGILGHDDEWF